MDLEDQYKFVKECLNKNLLASDFLVCLFVSALNSFRHDSVLRPFPPQYLINHGNKDFERLISDFSLLDSLDKIESTNIKPKENLIKLIHWLLDTKRFKLKLCDKDEFHRIKEKVGPSYKSATPSYVFEVKYSQEADERFKKLQNGRRLLHAYHGSRLENFYSILHNGLSGTLNKTSLFGEGTYLSSELAMCLVYSPFSHSWTSSILGQKLSCVAVCEMVDCEFLKCQVEKLEDKSDDTCSSNTDVSNNAATNMVRNNQRSRIKGSLGGDIPEKYYIATNDEVIRIKYIMVYALKEKYPRSKESPWYSRHGFLLVLLSYFIVLLSIGLYKSSYLKQILKYMYK